MILVIGGTGTIGSQVVRALAEHPVDITVLSKSGDRAGLPSKVTIVEGDVRDVDAMRGLLARTRTLFLLNPVVADELTRSLLTLSLAADAGIERVVYFSMLCSEAWTDVPHASAKFAAERMIEDRRINASILRPCYFMQNDAGQKDTLLQHGVYAMPVGQVGVESVDARDIGEVAALELVKREHAKGPLPTETIEIVGPEELTGDAIAKLWSEALGRPIRYGGDVAAFEKAARNILPADMAYDTALMFRHIQTGGYLGTPGAAERLASRLGRKLRTYRALTEELRDQWLGPRARPVESELGAQP
jgi:uncharacterized protein YbjT (DUF2867 family)